LIKSHNHVIILIFPKRGFVHEEKYIKFTGITMVNVILIIILFVCAGTYFKSYKKNLDIVNGNEYQDKTSERTFPGMNNNIDDEVF